MLHSLMGQGDAERRHRRHRTSHLIASKIADSERICIYGASYGGYAAMWGLARDPASYKCGISYAGASDIESMFKDWPDANANKVARELMRLPIGDIRLNNVEFDAVSPIEHAGRITAPVPLMHAKLDERVPHARKREAYRQGCFRSCVQAPALGISQARP